jgi:hypothetical protein
MARMLAASANNAAYTLNCYIVNKSIQTVQEQHTLTSSRSKIVTVELKEDSNTVGFCRSSDDGGGEEVVNEIWTPMAEATRKGIFNRLMVLCWTVLEPAMSRVKYLNVEGICAPRS